MTDALSGQPETETAVQFAVSLVRGRGFSGHKAASETVRIWKLDPSLSQTIESCVLEELTGICPMFGNPDPFKKLDVSDYLDLYETSLTQKGMVSVLGTEFNAETVRMTIRLFIENNLN